MSPSTQKVVTLKTRPVTGIEPSYDAPDASFALERRRVPTEADLKDGEVVIKNEYCGIEPSMVSGRARTMER